MEKKAIAITGMSCIFPGANDLDSYWKNILAGKSAIRPIPKNRNIDCVIEENDINDQIRCTHGGFLDAEIPFPPLEYGIIPSICEQGDPEQLLTLQMSDRALKDSGIDPEKEDLTNTEIIIGRGGYLGNFLTQGFQKVEILPQVINVIQQLAPDVSKSKLAKINAELKACFAHLNTDRAALAIPNISTGRIANRFNMMGANYTIDAACASALIAAENAVMSLRQERCDRVITGGIYLASNPSFWWLFSRLGAVSESGALRSFSKNADGLLAGEGIGILVFERLEDAVKAGRRVYAVIRGIGTSSDGKGAGLMAPRKEGQIECLRRAYRDAGIDPKTIDLLEGHGTATKVGDQTELEAINEFFGLSVAGIPTRALGSVKSMIGHTMPASGAASLIKIALSVYHKILPPTLCDDEVAEGLTGSSFYLNTASRPWVHPPVTKRRAGINAFGFGGINGHAILEEYEETGAALDDLVMDWPMELFLLAGHTLDELQAAISELLDRQSGYQTEKKLFGLLSMDTCKQGNKYLDYRLGIIAENFESLAEKLRKAGDLLKETKGQKPIQTDGIFFETEPLKKSGKIVFVFPGNAFPGLGDDYTERLAELSLYLPCFRAWFDLLELEKTRPNMPYPYATMLFSPTKIEHEKFVKLKKELRMLDNSSSGVFVANSASNDLMTRLGIIPDMITGTSLGEWSAVAAAGMIGLDQIATMDAHAESPEIDEIKGAIGLSQCSIEKLQPYFDEFNRDQVTVKCSMNLSPAQVVFGGTREGVERFCKFLNDAGIWAKYLNLFPIHTYVCQPVADHIYKRLAGLRVSKAKIPVYSAATTEHFPEDAEGARRLLADNAILPVQMRTLFEKLYGQGARIFVQLGGGGKIATPICETLSGKQFSVLTIDTSNSHPISQLLHVLASLYAHHTKINPDMLYDSRRRYLNRSGVKKDKRSEFVVKLNTTVPRFQIKNERLVIKHEADKPAITEIATKQPSANILSMQESPSSATSQWEEILSAQMNTMTRIYALQKEDELADMAHFTNMLKCQAQLILSENGNATTPVFQHKIDDRRVEPETEAMPFIGKIEEHIANQKIVISRVLTLESDLFLKDHAFIPCPNEIKSPEEKLPTLPMAVAMEIICEAAKTLLPGTIVRGLKEISNKRWIYLTESIREKELVITAQVKKKEVAEEIEVDCSIFVNGQPREISFTGTVLLANNYCANNKDLPISGELKPTQIFKNSDPQSLYRPGGLYHGACFQGLQAILQTTDRGMEALLTVPSLKGFFANHGGHSMILPAQTIDVASQLIYCYDLGMETRNSWVAPVSIERILIYKPSPVPGTQVKAKLMVRDNDSHLVRFDVLLEANGETFMVIIGWRDWRMKWSDSLVASWKNPSKILFAQKKESHTTITKEFCAFYGIDSKELSGIEPDWLARLYLNSREYKNWCDLPKENKGELLIEYIAIKDAARGLLQQKNIFIYPSQVHTKQNSKGLFSIKISDNNVTHSAPLSVMTSKQDNETLAMAVPEPIEDLADVNFDIFKR